MDWNDVDWSLLRQMREGFLKPEKSKDYWASRKELEHYDLTFAARIGSKWRAVLEEVGDRDLPDSMTLVDWGAGTGMASRVFGEEHFEKIKEVLVWDRSALAASFAVEKLKAQGLEARVLAPAEPIPEPYWLLASHVWNELMEPGIFLETLQRSEGFFWVEPGTPAISRAILEVRAMARESFEVLAPCPHQSACGLLAPENDAHWCHHFAPPDPEVFTTREWKRFSKELQIDLRSLPVSYLVATKSERRAFPPGTGRVIGRPRVYKGFVKGLLCTEEGVSDEKIFEGRSGKRFLENCFARWVE